jgi:hypothetical protein
MFGARTLTDGEPARPITWSGEWECHASEDRGEVVVVERPRRLLRVVSSC